MSYTVLPISHHRKVTLCGTNVYPVPETHFDRILSEHDLLYIYSGEQPVAQEDESFTLQTGDIILLRAGSHHYGTAPCSVNMRSIFIHFNTLPGDHGEKFLTREELEEQGSGTVILPTVVHCGQNNAATKIINYRYTCQRKNNHPFNSVKFSSTIILSCKINSSLVE